MRGFSRSPRLSALAGICAALLASPTARPDSPQPGYTAEQLAAKNAEAKGGVEKLRAISTLRRTGTLLVNGGALKLGFTQMQKRRAEGGTMIRDEADLQGLTVIQAFDVVEGWQINPLQGRKDPERTPLDDNKGLIEDADIDGPLVNWQAKGSKLEYLGTEDVDGTPALKLRVTRSGGDVQLVYLDPDYFLEIRTVSQRTEHGVPIEMQADYGDYEKVGGVYFPFDIVSGKKGSADTQTIQFEKGEANVDIKDAKFHFPTPSVTVGPVTDADHH